MPQVRPENKPDFAISFNLFTPSKCVEPWEQVHGFVDTDQRRWCHGAHVGVKWEVSGGWLDTSTEITVPEDQIAIIFYIPQKKRGEWEEYLSAKDERLKTRISHYPRTKCKSYALIGREYQRGDGEIIDLIHDMAQRF